MKNLIITSVLVITSSSLFSQNTAAAFSSLKVYDKIPVELIPSSDYKTEVKGNKASDVEFVNSGNEMKVKMKASKLLQGDDVKVIIYYKDLNSIQASQGAKISSSSEIKATKLDLVSNEGSDITLPINTKVLEAKTNTGGSLSLSGNAESQNVTVSTGGTYNAKNLSTEITSISINAGGKAAVTATKSIDATTRAGGVIDVYGNPSIRNDKKVAGGKINYK